MCCIPNRGWAWSFSSKYFDSYKKSQTTEVLNLYNDVVELREKYEAVKAKEQSLANRMLGAVAMGAGGIGGMMLASGLTEQGALNEAEADMRAYLETFRCELGTGQKVKGGDKNVQIPGGSELVPLYSEYVALANDLKKRKEQLGMKPGIEAESILDSATTGLYDDVSVGIMSGVYTSLSRALQDPDGEDAKKWSEQKEESSKKVETGATVGAVGVAGVAVGNVIINRDKGEKNEE